MSQVFEVQCLHCQSIFDLDQDPNVSKFNCPCLTREGSTVFKKYWITCSINRRHHYWANHSEDCKHCAEEKAKKPIISLRNEGVSAHGVKVKMVDEFSNHTLPPLATLSHEQREKISQQNRQDQIIALLQD